MFLIRNIDFDHQCARVQVDGIRGAHNGSFEDAPRVSRNIDIRFDAGASLGHIHSGHVHEYANRIHAGDMEQFLWTIDRSGAGVDISGWIAGAARAAIAAGIHQLADIDIARGDDAIKRCVDAFEGLHFE